MLIAAAAHPLDAGAALRARLAGFAGFLQANGYGVGGADGVDVLAAAERTGVLDARVLRWSLKALLCGRADEWRRFDALFDAYFLPPNRKAFAQSPGASPAAAGAAAQAGGTAGAAPDAGDSARRAASRHGASPDEALAPMDLQGLADAGQARALEALVRRFARRLKRLLLRREARSHRGRRIDLQGTIRHSVASGGTPIRLAWKQPRRVRPRLVLLLDVSRSMRAYAFFHLRLARALCAELADVHCFVFHTRLTDAGTALRDADPWRSQERLHLLAEGWGGGTRIGESLAQFARGPGARLVHSRTAVVIASDGYDTGEPQVLAAALASIRRRARRIVWLNPLLGQPGFRPESRGMQAALPHLDLLAPGADLAGLERVLPQVIEALR